MYYRPAKNKYGNSVTDVNGIRFASKAEARRYSELMLMLKAGEIKDLRLQLHFSLIEPCTLPDGSKVEREDYVADFAYYLASKTADGETAWQFIVEDVKGHKTDVYKLKYKQMLDRYGIAIREVRYR